MKQIGKRLLTVIPSLIGVIIVTFLLTRVLPGDTAAYFAGPAASAQAIEEIRKQLGLDKPLPEQFVRYVVDLAHGDFGKSLTTGQPVLEDIATRLPASAELTLAGLIVAMLIAVPLGILAAVKQGSLIDHACRIVATAGVSLPVFFTGLLLIYVFYFKLGWAPAPLGRLDVFYSAPPTITGFYLIDSLITGDFEVFRAVALAAHPADCDARDLLAGADRAHDPRLDALGAGVGFRAHRAGRRPVVAHGDPHLRVP